MKGLCLLLLLQSSGVFAQNQDHAGMTMPAASADPPASMAQSSMLAREMHGGTLNYLVLGERFEYLQDDALYNWEAQGWLGYDLDKLWLKTEGEYSTDSDETEHLELQTLYSRAVSSFWDVQTGLRFDEGEFESRQYAVLGLMGLAPYWFEIDAAAFISDEGNVSSRLEAEYELRFTQRLILQPRLELNFNFSEDLAAGTGKGMQEASIGLRLRYEFRREFAPYIGVEWSRNYGNTATLFRSLGVGTESTSFVAGLRFWY